MRLVSCEFKPIKEIKKKTNFKIMNKERSGLLYMREIIKNCQ